MFRVGELCSALTLSGVVFNGASDGTSDGNLVAWRVFSGIVRS